MTIIPFPLPRQQPLTETEAAIVQGLQAMIDNGLCTDHVAEAFLCSAPDRNALLRRSVAVVRLALDNNLVHSRRLK